MTDWYSAVGMLRRVASLCRRASTLLPAGGFAFRAMTSTSPGGARRRLPSPRPGAPPASPASRSEGAGKAPPPRAALAGAGQHRRAPPEDAGPRAGADRPGAGTEARRPAVDRAGSPPRGRRGGGGDRAARDSRAWWGHREPSDGGDA